METISASKIPPILYILAGPPGVGKSHNWQAFVPLKPLNHDEIAADLKKEGIRNYEEYAEQKIWEQIHENITLGVDFGIELNLGYSKHYGLLRKIYGHCKHYAIHVLLFFTDVDSLCSVRATEREKAGGQEVEPAAIEEMRCNTIGLLKKNIAMFSYVSFIDVTYNSVELVYSGYYPNRNHEFVNDVLPNWVSTNFPEIAI